MLEIVDYYNYNKSDVFVLMLDASKAFDKVRYCKLSIELLDRDIPPVLIILIENYMCMNQTLTVQWCQTLTSSGKVCNGVKQGVVLFPILFVVYVDSLLSGLEQIGVGCHIGGHFVGALGYADDVTLVAPSRSGIRTLINVCEQFALGTKSQFRFLKVDFIMFLLVAFMLMGNMLKFLIVQCTLVIPYL